MSFGPAQTIFFVPGFDRRDGRRFWALQRGGIARCQRATRLGLSISDPVFDDACARWTYRFGANACDFVHLGWSDIVKARFDVTFVQRIWDVLHILCAGLANGFWARACKRGGGLGIAIALGFLPAALIWLGLALALFWLPFFGLVGLGALLGARPEVRYIQHIAWGARMIATGQNPALEQRICAHAKVLAAHCDQQPARLTFLVGHSLGGALAFRIWHAAGRPPNCRIITLGTALSLVEDQGDKFWATCIAPPGQTAALWSDIFYDHDPLKSRKRALALIEPDQSITAKMTGERKKHAPNRTWARHFDYLRFVDQPSTNWDWLSFLRAASGASLGISAQSVAATSAQDRGAVKRADPAPASSSIAAEI